MLCKEFGRVLWKTIQDSGRDGGSYASDQRYRRSIAVSGDETDLSSCQQYFSRAENAADQRDGICAVFVTDTKAETDFVEQFCKERGCEFALSEVWEKGGEGGIDLANKVLETIEHKESNFKVLYDDSLSLKEKIETVAKEIYGADGVTYSPAAERELKRITDLGMGDFPVCMAKTQYSLSDDAKKLGRPSGFKINVREVYASAGAGFVVAVNGSIMTMPGLSKKPAAYGIDVDDNGVITGLF